MLLTPLKRERATDAVYRALREAILDGLLRPGERLDVAELAERLGVSLTPVRHALQMLATEGLVEVRPRSGTYVAGVSASDVRDTFDVRCALECLAAELAVERVRREEIRRMKKLVQEMTRPIRTARDRHAHAARNSEFHMILLRAAGNRRLLALYEELHAHIQIARIHATDKEWPWRLEQEGAEHRAIVTALEKRDLPRLIEALRRHIFRARDSLVAAVERVQSKTPDREP